VQFFTLTQNFKEDMKVVLSNQEFLSYVTAYLDEVLIKIEEKYWNVADSELSEGVLTVCIDDVARPFIINRNVPMQQLWMSSPISGGSHYELLENKWVDTQTKEEFESRLFLDLEKIKRKS